MKQYAACCQRADGQWIPYYPGSAMRDLAEKDVEDLNERDPDREYRLCATDSWRPID